MKSPVLLIVLLCSFYSLSAQRNEFTTVDSFAAIVGYQSPDSLAKRLTRPYTSERQKVRSIFYWITQHIGYDVEEAKEPRYYHFTYYSRQDSIRKRKEMVRETVRTTLAKHKGICEDYADVFNTLCELAKIKSVMVTGYSRGISDSIGHTKAEDHAWNAVMIDNKWQLLDVTWASGYIDERDGTFAKRFNEYYFLTEPDLMMLNHFPSTDQWLLTKNSVSLPDFFNLPVIYFDQTSNPMHTFLPRSGTINVRQGETIKFTLEVPDTTKNIRLITYPNEVLNPDYSSSYMDKTHAGGYAAATGTATEPKRHYIQVNNNADDIYSYLDKQKKTSVAQTQAAKNSYTGKNKLMVRNYTVTNPRLQSITVIYNDEPMLKYNVNIIK